MTLPTDRKKELNRLVKITIQRGMTLEELTNCTCKTTDNDVTATLCKKFVLFCFLVDEGTARDSRALCTLLGLDIDTIDAIQKWLLDEESEEI
jgi:hypothetical protein